MASDSVFYSIHPFSRFLFGIALMSLAFMSASFTASMLILLVCMLFTLWLEQSRTRVIRSLKLLRWFVAPIFILHLCFSPGELIFPLFALPFTWEGLMQGGFLAAHLAVIFMAAVALFLCLRRSEWIKAILSLPLIGEKLRVYILIAEPLQRSVGEKLRFLRQAWQIRESWREFPLLLLAAFRITLSAADEQSQQLWLRWPAGSLNSEQDGWGTSTSSLPLNLLCAAVGVLGVMIAWLM